MRPLLFALVLLLVSGQLFASPYDVVVTEEDVKQAPVYSPHVGRAYPDNVFFGDTHFHTNLSFDAGLVGTRLDAHAGFRFARGEEVNSNTGQRVQLIRPLDFLAITDHAELIGLAPMLQSSDPLLLADPWGKWAHEQFNAGQEGRMALFAEIIRLSTVEGTNPFSNDAAARNIWQRFVELADTYNEPGRFTTLTGFEWSSTPKGDNLHRVVMFADGADRTSQIVPFSMFDSDDPEDLWRFLANYEDSTGGRAISPAHNGNVSNGLMFDGKDFKGKKIDRAYAELRMRFEQLYEVTQGRWGSPSFPVPRRRICRLRKLGRGQSCRNCSERGLDAALRVRPLSAEAGAEDRPGHRRQPLQVRPVRHDRYAYRAGHLAGRKFLRQVPAYRTVAGTP
jgi:hypothetical protein